MTLTKAREILLLEQKRHTTMFEHDLHLALYLALEATNFIILARISAPRSVPAIFHGETEELASQHFDALQSESRGM